MLKKLCEKLSGVNLVSGFRATGLHPLDRQQVLKRLPGSSRDLGGEETNDILNDSVMNLLRNHFGAGSTNRRGSNRRGKRIVPGRPMTNHPAVILIKKLMQAPPRQLLLSEEMIYLHTLMLYGPAVNARIHGMRREMTGGLCAITAVSNFTCNVQEFNIGEKTSLLHD